MPHHHGRCAAQCSGCHGVTRRQFVATASASLVTASLLRDWFGPAAEAFGASIAPCGPAASYTPKVRACFVRRQGDYGIRWPGSIYDGEAARKKYIGQIQAAAKRHKIKLDLKPEPLYSADEADAWIAESAKAKPDGLLVVLLDRQQHAWPTADKAIDTGIPTVIFSPVGTSFTTNTAGPSRKTGGFIASTDDFRQVEFGLKMLQAGARMRNTRCLVIRGNKTADGELADLGIKLHTIPAKTFLAEYEKTPTDGEIQAMAADLMKNATGMVGATKDDVINGIKSFVVARKLLEREKCDAITMDCLGALGKTKVSLPCIAWSVMNDAGIPSACEADLGAVATHTIVQYLLDRPGFQQDPVGETAREAIIGAHCCCPTKLGGFDSTPEPYDIVHHHGVRDATRRPVWKVGQRITCVDVLPGADDKPSQMLISSGEVLENVSVPPAGGCVVSVMAKFDNVSDVLAYPGFHQLFCYGDFKRELTHFCRLFNIVPVVV